MPSSRVIRRILLLDFHSALSLLPTLFLSFLWLFYATYFGQRIDFAASVFAPMMIFLMTTALSSFTRQRLNGVQKLYGALPLSWSLFVRGRYSYFALHLLCGWFLSLVTTLLYGASPQIMQGLQRSLFGNITGLSLLLAVMIPNLLRLGKPVRWHADLLLTILGSGLLLDGRLARFLPLPTPLLLLFDLVLGTIVLLLSCRLAEKLPVNHTL